MSSAPAADQALTVLGLLSRHGEPLPAATLASQAGIPRSTTYRLLGVLIDHGFVVHLPESRRYGLGVAAHELAWAYARQAPLQRMARPMVAELVQRTRLNVHLAVLQGADVLYLIEERFPGRPSLVTDVGVRLPAHLTASGLAMLAGLPARQVRALHPSAMTLITRTGAGPATPTALRRELIAIRQRGYATEDGTVTPALSSVAVAASDHTGLSVAAFAVTFDTEALAAAQRDRVVIEVRRAAVALTTRLGG